MCYRHHERLSKLLESRENAESGVGRIYKQNDEAVQNGDRRVRVESLIGSCKDAITKAVKRHDQLFNLTQKVDDSASLLREQWIWLNVLTTTNDKKLKRARQYKYLLPTTDNKSQSSSKTTKKTTSSNSVTSKTSSQRQKELLIAKHCTEKPSFRVKEQYVLINKNRR